MESIQFFADNKIIFVVLHVLSVVMGMGSALISDLLFNFYSKDKHLNDGEIKTLKFLGNAVWVSLVFIILSGLAIFFSDPYKYEHSQKFISKMTIMALLLLNGLFLHVFVAPHFEDKGLLKFKNKRPVRQIAFACGAVSLLSWTVVCVLGTLKSIPIHASNFLMIYLGFVFLAVIFSLFVEKITFSNKNN